MPRKKKAENEVVMTAKNRTFYEEDLKILDEVLTDYKGYARMMYAQALAFIAGYEELEKKWQLEEKLWDQLERYKDMYEKSKENAPMLDIAHLRADSIHLKVKEALGIKEEDEDIKPVWAGEPQDGAAADEPSAEVSESTEVLPEEG